MHIINNIDFVGLQEKTDIDYSRLCEFYNWNSNFSKKKRRKTKKNNILDFDWDELRKSEILFEINKYDIKLYNFILEN